MGFFLVFFKYQIFKGKRDYVIVSLFLSHSSKLCVLVLSELSQSCALTYLIVVVLSALACAIKISGVCCHNF